MSWPGGGERSARSLRSEHVTPGEHRKRIDEVRTELRTLRIGGTCVMSTVVPAVREILDTDIVLLYSVAEHETGWSITRWHHSGVTPECGPLLASALSRTSVGSVFYYDVLRPAAEQRNRVLEASSWIDREQPGTWESSRMCREVMAPLKLHRHRQPRALICDGPVLLAWFGALQARPVARAQVRTLSALVPAMKQRLALERQLQGAPRTASALQAALEQLGTAAFIIKSRGAIVETNQAGRALLESSRAEVRRAMEDAIAQRPNALGLELVPLAERGVPGHILVIVRGGSPDARVDACVQACIMRWSLTPRQAQVLELVARGLANTTIAAMLGIGERSIEHHMTAIFDCAGVDGRAALVAMVLTAV